jgi:negative regulator of flagellin synthesis FlgM
MKINSPADIASAAAALKTASTPKPGQGAAASATATAVQSTRAAGVAVTVSTLARSLETSETTQPGDIDMAKVASVKSAISDGTYVVNPEAIADKLLSNAQEMLNRTAR